MGLADEADGALACHDKKGLPFSRSLAQLLHGQGLVLSLCLDVVASHERAICGRNQARRVTMGPCNAWLADDA